MLHAQLVVHRLAVDGVDVGLRHATMVIVARDESATVEWEVVADRVDAGDAPDLAPGRAPHRLDLVCIVGADDDGRLELAELAGPAEVVRVVDRTVVLRGTGPLTGLDPAHLAP